MKEKLNMLATCTLLTALALSGCGNSEPQESQELPLITSATTVFTHGNIYTVNPQQPWAESVAIKDGNIIYVGDNTAIKQYIGQQTQVINLQGKMMMPGIHDVHIHPLESGSDATHFSLDENEYNIENYIDEIAYAANANPEAAWLIGYGHTIGALLDAKRSPREILDDAVPNRPVIIMEQTSHSMWVNSKALELANISKNSSDAIGGVVSRDNNGIPDGILYDNTGNVVMDIAMRAQPSAAESNYLGLVEYTIPALNKHGITSISDARTYWQRGHLATWQRVEQAGSLTLRVNLGLWAYPEANDDSQLRELAALYQANPDSNLKINQVKFYMDGILINTTAAMHAPYEANWLDLYQNKGLNYFSQTRLEKYIKVLEPMGFDFNIHAIGDRGITEALNAIENASGGQSRHRITHVEVVDPDDLPRFKALNVIADAQVAGDFTQPAHWPENSALIGTERSKNLVPIGSLQAHDATLTLSSDWNVSTFNTFVGISHAVSRAPENISLAQAIQAYTINGAYAMQQDGIVGSIEVGKQADLIVLDRDLFSVSSEQIKNTQVLMTLLKGQQVYMK